MLIKEILVDNYKNKLKFGRANFKNDKFVRERQEYKYDKKKYDKKKYDKKKYDKKEYDKWLLVYSKLQKKYKNKRLVYKNFVYLFRKFVFRLVYTFVYRIIYKDFWKKQNNKLSLLQYKFFDKNIMLFVFFKHYINKYVCYFFRYILLQKVLFRRCVFRFKRFISGKYLKKLLKKHLEKYLRKYSKKFSKKKIKKLLKKRVKRFLKKKTKKVFGSLLFNRSYIFKVLKLDLKEKFLKYDNKLRRNKIKRVFDFFKRKRNLSVIRGLLIRFLFKKLLIRRFFVLLVNKYKVCNSKKGKKWWREHDKAIKIKKQLRIICRRFVFCNLSKRVKFARFLYKILFSRIFSFKNLVLSLVFKYKKFTGLKKGLNKKIYKFCKGKKNNSDRLFFRYKVLLKFCLIIKKKELDIIFKFIKLIYMKLKRSVKKHSNFYKILRKFYKNYLKKLKIYRKKK